MRLPDRLDRVDLAYQTMRALTMQGMPYDEAHWWATQDLTPREAYLVTKRRLTEPAAHLHNASRPHEA